MSRSTVMIAVFPGQATRAHDLQKKLREGWTDPPAPAFELRHGRGFPVETEGDIDLIIVLVDEQVSTTNLQTWLGLLEQSGTSVLLLADHGATLGTDFGGVVELPLSLPGQRLCDTIRGMLVRTREVSELRQELSLVRRFHGGLEGQLSRMHEELQLAAMVQRDLLPETLPSLCGIRVGAMWRPANYVSGDIYDVTRLDEDHLGIFLADAVGHGVPAALMTMVINRSLITREVDGSNYRILPPAEALKRLNERMIDRKGAHSRFATAIYAVINCRERTVTIAGAGHPPPILMKPSGETRQIETNGGLLGVFENEAYDEVTLELELDDRILFYSDGFEQAFPRKHADPYQMRLPTVRYRDEFAKLAKLPSPNDMIEHIRGRVDSQRGSLHQADDMTLICLHAGPLATGNEDMDEHAAARNADLIASSSAAARPRD